MDKNKANSHEQVVWESYLEKCRAQGTKPSAKDFANWAKSIMTNGSP